MTRNNNLTQNNFIRNWWRRIDQQMIISLLVLVVFSLMLVTTASPAVAVRIGLPDNYFSSRHVMFLFGASLIVLFFSSLSKIWIRRFAIIGFLISLSMLSMVKLYGFEVKGATRWISIAGLSYQPSEFVKPCFAVVVGWILSLNNEDADFPSFKVCSVLFLTVAGLLVAQPDFGMLVMLSAGFGLQLFVAGLPLIWIFIAIAGSISGIIGAYILLPHVTSRINNFLSPANNENYQVTKSLEAFESGGFYGRGPGEGIIKQHLPDSHADFIFAVAGEEFGILICLMIIATFAWIVIRTLLHLLHEQDRFTQIAAIGIIAQFGLQAIINIGVTLNLLPTKGMTLPLISYGGSSTFAIAIALGMLVGLTKRKASLVKYRIHNADVY